MTVAQSIVHFIQNKNLKHVFGVSGANIEELFHSFTQSSIKPVLAKTEYQATLMAVGSHLATQQAHVVLTTSGAGVLNTLPVLAEAYSSRQPVVLIAGLPPAHLEGKGGFQDTSSLNGSLNLQALLNPLVCFQQKITSAEQVAEALNQAFHFAEREKRPAVLLVNRNVFSQQLDSVKTSDSPTATFTTGNSSPLKEKLTASKDRPLFILGEELIHLKNRSLLKKVAKKFNAFIACTPQAKGFYDHADSCFVGLTGMMGTAKAEETLALVSQVLLIGSRMDHLSRFGSEETLAAKNVFHISAFEEKAFIRTELSVVGPLDLILEELL